MALPQLDQHFSKKGISLFSIMSCNNGSACFWINSIEKWWQGE